MTELWERFAYFSVCSILVLFMIQDLSLSDKQAYLIFASFSALLFVTPVIGGYLADNLLGYVHSIILGAILLATGYFLLSLNNHSLLFLALSISILGNGLFKPNISSLLGTCYQGDDARRESGFTIFYIGINIGATIGVILCGFIAKIWGWSLAFLIAGSVLLLGLTIFFTGLKIIRQESLTLVAPKKLQQIVCFYVGLILLIGPITILLMHPQDTNILLSIFASIILGLLGTIIWRSSKDKQKNLLICIMLTLFSIAFWALYQQAPMSLMLFIQRDVDRHILGLTIPASTIWSLNGIFLILLAPLLIRLWEKLKHHNLDPSISTKFALGILLMGLGYILLVLAAHGVSTQHRTTLWWIVMSFAVQTLGELCLSPIGLAMITQLAPEKLRGMLMGIWFLALAAATAIAGQLAKLASLPKDHIDQLTSAVIYSHAFLIYGLLAIGVSIILFIVSPWLRYK
jgi:POT family proton-dependent oligopeptide transporter